MWDRVLLATICNQGDRTCLQCTMPQTDFHRLGQQRDMKACSLLSCSYRSDLVNRAQDCIYKDGFFITSARVECLLKLLSLVPMAVRLIIYYILSFAWLKSQSLEHFFRETGHIRIQSPSHACSQLNAWIRARCMEDYVYAYHLSPICCGPKWQCCSGTEQKVIQSLPSRRS